MKHETELMTKALELLAQLKGFNLNEIHLISQMMAQQALNLQVFEPDPAAFDATVQEWQDAFEQARSTLR
ncbi:hypothetical protein EV693_10612 [Nicoletella semolina]|uniref:Uncharacterized protein n=1 Tax=Nicoletella semolina TaxID=271160 RepID=A0A4R2N8N5_9PAST|nr:hypothetical protein [Nicoletella semolina]MDH2924538.1 hypothetical protein [Nicoletella semolina]TCP17333.1 hypothetical protein EV693_10612 [Nicoletella semolina]